MSGRGAFGKQCHFGALPLSIGGVFVATLYHPMPQDALALARVTVPFSVEVDSNAIAAAVYAALAPNVTGTLSQTETSWVRAPDSSNLFSTTAYAAVFACQHVSLPDCRIDREVCRKEFPHAAVARTRHSDRALLSVGFSRRNILR